MPNCIALSTDGHTLYVAETMTGRLWAWEIEAPGVLKGKARNILGGTSRIVIGLPGFSRSTQWLLTLMAISTLERFLAESALLVHMVS